MKPITKFILVIIILMTGLVVGRVLPPPPDSSSQLKNTNTSSIQSSYETKENEGGNVTVSITPLFLKPGLPASFDMAFETHSVDLLFDVVSIATLTDNTETLYTPLWDGSPPGGHHRKGTLRFIPDLSTATTLTLTFRDIAGIPARTFSWEVKQ